MPGRPSQKPDIERRDRNTAADAVSRSLLCAYGPEAPRIKRLQSRQRIPHSAPVRAPAGTHLA